MAEEKREYLTKQKYEELVKELKNLKTIERKKVAEALNYARGLGDLSENADYHEARSKQAEVEEKITNIENILKNSLVIENKHGDYAIIGSTVIVEKIDGSKKMTLMIIGSAESDLASSKISNKSPLGSAILGKKKGDYFSFISPSGKMEYKIIEVK